jgi:hypothetical protein
MVCAKARRIDEPDLLGNAFFDTAQSLIELAAESKTLIF